MADTIKVLLSSLREITLSNRSRQAGESNLVANLISIKVFFEDYAHLKDGESSGILFDVF